MRKAAVLFAVILAIACVAVAQEEATTTSQAREHARPRVFITDSHSWETGAGGGGVDGTWGAAASGGARPQTAEIIKTFNQRCPNVQINNIVGKSDYVVVLEHEGGKSFISRDNKVAVFERVSGDSIMSESTRALGSAVQNACARILQHWPANYLRMSEAAEAEVPISTRRPMLESARVLQPISRSAPRLTVESSPVGADIEVDGSFMGNTPSSLELNAGEHDVILRKAGFRPWQRHLKVNGGNVRLTAELERE